MDADGSFHNIFVETAIDGSNGEFHIHRQCKINGFPWKLPLTSMEANILPPATMELSME